MNKLADTASTVQDKATADAVQNVLTQDESRLQVLSQAIARDQKSGKLTAHDVQVANELKPQLEAASAHMKAQKERIDRLAVQLNNQAVTNQLAQQQAQLKADQAARAAQQKAASENLQRQIEAQKKDAQARRDAHRQEIQRIQQRQP